MNKVVVFLVFFGLAYTKGYSSGRIMTPYFKTVGYYDYIIKGKVIDYKSIDTLSSHLVKFKIVIMCKETNDLNDTFWINPRELEVLHPYQPEINEVYYIELKKIDGQLYYYSFSSYAFLHIVDGCVSTDFTGFDIFINKKLYLRIHRKMKVERFEKKLKRRIDIAKDKSEHSRETDS